jgi:hypothetical protein
MFALDMVGDIVDKHARHQRGDRGHQEHRAEHDAETGGDRDNPGDHIEQGVKVGTEHRLGPDFA